MLTLGTSVKNWQVPFDKLIIIEGATENDYWDLATEDLKVEFAEGKLFIHSPASIYHEKIFGFLYRLINYYLEEHNLGEMLGSRVAIRLPNGKRPEPDLVYLESGSYDITKDRIYDGIPKWVIEILSTSTKEHDLERKFQWYEENKVQEYWIVDLDNNQLLIHELNDKTGVYQIQTLKEGIIHPLNFTNFNFDVTWIWTLPKLGSIKPYSV